MMAERLLARAKRMPELASRRHPARANEVVLDADLITISPSD